MVTLWQQLDLNCTHFFLLTERAHKASTYLTGRWYSVACRATCLRSPINWHPAVYNQPLSWSCKNTCGVVESPGKVLDCFWNQDVGTLLITVVFLCEISGEGSSCARVSRRDVPRRQDQFHRRPFSAARRTAQSFQQPDRVWRQRCVYTGEFHRPKLSYLFNQRHCVDLTLTVGLHILQHAGLGQRSRTSSKNSHRE